jgi:hypothetical protein
MSWCINKVQKVRLSVFVFVQQRDRLSLDSDASLLLNFELEVSVACSQFVRVPCRELANYRQRL